MSYEVNNITPEQETKINEYMLILLGHPSFDAAEKQEIFLKYLEAMDLTKEQVRNIFCKFYHKTNKRRLIKMTGLTKEEKVCMGIAKCIFRKYANDIEVGYGSDYFGDSILHEIEEEYLIDCMYYYLEDAWDEHHIRNVAIYHIQEAL